MAFDVSQLSEWVDEQSMDLMAKALFEGRTASYFRVQPGVKHKATINIMETDAVFQAQNCALTPSGSTEFTQRELEVGKIKVEEVLCLTDFNEKYLSGLLPAGSADDTSDIFGMYGNRKVQQIQKTNETKLWQGDKDSGDLYDGVLKQLDEVSGSVITPSISPAAITIANVEDVIDSVYQAIPADVIDEDNVRIFVSNEVFRLYTSALRDSNLFHFAPDATTGEYVLPGTNVTITRVNGLNGTGEIVAGVAGQGGNFIIGTDLEDESERFVLFYSERDDNVIYRTKFKLGVNVAFPEQIVHYKSA